MTTCGEALLKLLEAYGVEIAVGIPGTHTIELYRGLPATGIRHITPRHEQGAGFVADGYARVTGRPAVCLTISGPGALNIATPMGQALQDSMPMLVISADNRMSRRGLGQGRLHETRNLEAAMAECSVWSHTLMSADNLPEVLARAFSIFAGERPGPVHITIPVDVIASRADHIDTRARPLPGPPAPDPGCVKRAAELLNRAEAPVIALGGGAAGAAEKVRALCEQLDAPVTLTHNARGILPPTHPLLVRSGPSMAEVRELYRDADLLLAIGTEFSETDYDFMLDGGFSLSADVVRIDISAAQLVRNVVARAPILGDAALSVEALAPGVHRRSGDGAARTAGVNGRRRGYAGYQRLLEVFQEALPGAILICDSTQPAYFAASGYHAPAPRRFASAATGYGTLGYALGAAIGASLARPELPVIALIGDGGMQFCINELSTAVAAGTPVVILLWNNHGYDMIAQNFRDAGMTPIACDIHTPDFVGIARSYGCDALRVSDIDALRAALASCAGKSAPTLIEVKEQEMLAT